MYKYKVTDSKTGILIAEGTARELVEKGFYKSIDSVKNSYRSWERKTEQGIKVGVVWSRTGEEEHSKAGWKRANESRLHTRRCRTWQQKAARETRQAEADAAGRPKKPDWYTTETLGHSSVLPEHRHKFEQAPIEPPSGKGVDPIRWDVYEVECINWERKQQGRRPISYGEWRAGIR